MDGSIIITADFSASYARNCTSTRRRQHAKLPDRPAASSAARQGPGAHLQHRRWQGLDAGDKSATIERLHALVTQHAVYARQRRPPNAPLWVPWRASHFQSSPHGVDRIRRERGRDARTCMCFRGFTTRTHQPSRCPTEINVGSTHPFGTRWRSHAVWHQSVPLRDALCGTIMHAKPHLLHSPSWPRGTTTHGPQICLSATSAARARTRESRPQGTGLTKQLPV